MKRILIIVVCIAFLASCGIINPSQMLRTNAKSNIAHYPDSIIDEYRIAPDDIVSFTVMPNNGERAVTGILESGQGSANGLDFIVEYDGTTKLPLLGNVKFGGLTRSDAETMLEDRYSTYINDPYVKITVDNRRVFVFNGTGASVVKLENQNTTLFEVLAQTGGTTDSKAHKIKLIRKENNVPKVYLIDLSKVENINQGNIVLQSNDVVYISPRDRVAERIIGIIAPYLSLLATALATIAIFK